MGNWFSTTSSSQSSKPSLDELPESCVAAVMEYMDPPQICKLASLNRTFRGASFADFVWESKLPSNYQLILCKIFQGVSFPSHLGKRGIYSRLCSLNTFDDGTKVNQIVLFFVHLNQNTEFIIFFCRKFGWIEVWVRCV